MVRFFLSLGVDLGGFSVKSRSAVRWRRRGESGGVAVKKNTNRGKLVARVICLSQLLFRLICFVLDSCQW